MPWQIIPVEYSRASISCDWPGCTNQISLSAIPVDYDAEINELNKVRRLAIRRGWTVAPESYSVACCDHTPSNTEEKQ
jgi:hypothetical protein